MFRSFDGLFSGAAAIHSRSQGFDAVHFLLAAILRLRISSNSSSGYREDLFFLCWKCVSRLHTRWKIDA